MTVRNAAHAGSWYVSDGVKLRSQLQGFIDDAQTPLVPMDELFGGNSNLKLKALIGPHAGFRFSGPTAAYAYKHIDKDAFDRVFILGPSHHVHIDGCALSNASLCKTPIGDLKVDMETIDELRSQHKNMFAQVSMDDEEEEHSLEMHMPWVAKTFHTRVKVVPIIVGSLDARSAREYGHILAPYLANEKTFFIISSDFCHWGQRFRYTYHNEEWGVIYKSIEQLDKLGMSTIESGDPDQFVKYLKKYKNTICGRHPIWILMNACIADKSISHEIKFVHYSQSSQVKDKSDSSVSYAAGLVFQNIDSSHGTSGNGHAM